MKEGKSMTVEYRVNPITRWVITRTHSESAGCETVAELSSAKRADEIAQQLSKAEGVEYNCPSPVDPERFWKWNPVLEDDGPDIPTFL